MTKTAEKLLPADIAKAKLQPMKTAEEKAADEPNVAEVDEADLDAADAEEGPQPPVAEFDLSEGKPSEDPAIVEARKAAFERAELFERQREESRQRKAAMLAGAVSPVTIPSTHVGGEGEIPEIFYRYATAFPHTTPDEHIVCGYGSIKLTIGHFRRLIGLPTRT